MKIISSNYGYIVNSLHKDEFPSRSKRNAFLITLVRKLKYYVIFFLIMSACFSSAASAEQPGQIWTRLPDVKLQALNKISARTLPLDVTQKKPGHFGTLEIILHACWTSSEKGADEDAAFLEIREEKSPGKKSKIFYGWLFSNNAALSKFEHPVYDITVLGCVTSQ